MACVLADDRRGCGHDVTSLGSDIFDLRGLWLIIDTRSFELSIDAFIDCTSDRGFSFPG